MIRPKIIIFDLDGTAIASDPNAMPSQRVIEAVAAAEGKIKLVAATGRAATNAAHILKALGLKDPCVISAGSQIIDQTSGKILWEAGIPSDSIRTILELCRKYHYETFINNELMGEGQPIRTREIDEPVNVMYIVQCSESDGRAILGALNEVPGIIAAGVLSWANEGLDIHITSDAATKEHAVSELLGMLKIDRSESVGVGDGGNDLHLFNAVGYKIAMGNAVPELKAAADEICDTVDNDGLAKVIESYI